MWKIKGLAIQHIDIHYVDIRISRILYGCLFFILSSSSSRDTDDLTSGFGLNRNGDQSRISRVGGGGTGGGGTGEDSIIGTTSDYVLIAMIIAMMVSVKNDII